MSSLHLNNFTKSFPEFRANLCFYNKKNSFSSYQSEYPLDMTSKKGKMLSPLKTLTNLGALNYLCFKNIYHEPIRKIFYGYIVDVYERKIVDKFELKTNYTNFIKIEKDKLNDHFFFTKDYLGIPIFLSDDGKNLSCEHTHPPHEYLLGDDRFDKVNKLKMKIDEIINKEII